MDNPDILSEVFATLKLRSNLYFETELRGNFSVEIPQERRRIRFHLVRWGGCWLRVADAQAVKLRENDLAIIPNGVAQIVSQRADAEPVSLSRFMEDGHNENGVLTYGTGNHATRLLCGFCQFDEQIDHPVIAHLPPLMIVRPSDLGAEPWATTTIRLLGLEGDLKGQGMTGILSRLLEIVFIQAVRRLTPSPGAPASGFIAALSDPRLSRALYAMHAEPDTAWTINDLAQVAGMSRGRFAQKFAQNVGTPPIDYLTTWRLMKARSLLIGSSLDMADIAQRCGYRSVPSFSRRFKKAFQVSPGTFRRTAGSM
ncbi:MAG: AraC family transcriptional regulator [Aestuariivirgaceae bacterium]